MLIADRPLSRYVRDVQGRVSFALSRWGDGEWYSVLGRTRGRNCDGHRYFAAMGAELAGELMGRDAGTSRLWGIQPLARRLMGDQIDSWLVERGLAHHGWVDADVFHNASAAGELGPLVTALKEAPSLLVVGPPHLTRLAGPRGFLGHRHFVGVPPKDAYLSWRGVLREATSAASRLPDGSVISVSAGMPGKLLVSELYRRVAGRCSVIDFGSLWDVYAGVRSRRYMQDMNVPPP